jgi:23S rRNA (uracil1939-C5)-methyltransferase
VSNDDTFTAQVTAWAFGGAGILRHEGLAVFVPFTIPGDTIRCRILRQKKNFAEGVVDEILSPSHQRTTPRCPVYGKCGGCQLQHVSYAGQLEYKRKIVLDALQRIGKCKDISVNPVIPSTQEWHYRRHITLHIQEGKVGFLEIDNITLIEPKTCALFSDDVHLLAALKKLALLAPNGKVTLIKQNEKFLVEWHSGAPFSQEALQKIQQCPLWMGGCLISPTQKHTFGTTVGTVFFEDKSFTFEVGAFLQNHPEQSTSIYRSIRAKAEAMGAKKVLDLYSGIGITACLFSSLGAHVDAIEYGTAAVNAAKRNLTSHAKGKWRQYKGAVEKVLSSFTGHYDLALINPPRKGMHPLAIQHLLRLRPTKLLYLSCIQLLGSSYKIVECQPYDMFPQTAHVETLVELTL